VISSQLDLHLPMRTGVTLVRIGSMQHQTAR
jgi:hypothetical protein